VSPNWVGRTGRLLLIVSLGAFFALIGLLLVVGATGFGIDLAHCVPGARSVHGMTPMVGGGEMNSRLCASQVPPGVWPWPVVGVLAGGAFGVVFAVGVVTVLRAAIGRLRRPRRPASAAEPL